MIVCLKVCGRDLLIAVDQILKEILARDSEESSVFIFSFVEVRIIEVSDDLIIEGLSYHPHIVVYHTYFVMP